MQNVRKAVIPAGGLGTRFLPATKASPKEMLTIADKPLIQYAAEEAVEAGITELIFVIRPNTSLIVDHFDKSYELENELKKKNKIDLLESVKNILPRDVTCSYIRQASPLGLGHAVLCASNFVNDEPFAVLLPDDLIKCDSDGCLKQMVARYAQYSKAIVAVQQIPLEHSKRYGVVALEGRVGKISEVVGIVEKPPPEEAPSNLGVVGRYILPGRIMSLLKDIPEGVGNEIQLTDAIAVLVSEGEVDAYEFNGVRYDCGSKLGFLQANVDYGLDHPETSAEFRDWLSKKFDRSN